MRVRGLRGAVTAGAARRPQPEAASDYPRGIPIHVDYQECHVPQVPEPAIIEEIEIVLDW